MKIWLDDLRPAPWGYESARSVNEAKTLIREAERNGIEIEVLDLDHDLGDFANQGGDAIKLLDWLVERETFYPVEIHTANPVGRACWRGTGERSTGRKLDDHFVLVLLVLRCSCSLLVLKKFFVRICRNPPCI